MATTTAAERASEREEILDRLKRAATDPDVTVLRAQIEAMEQRLHAMEQRLHIVETMGGADRWLVGWPEIARHFRLPPRSMRRYLEAGCPILRVGPRVRTTPAMLQSWMLALERARLDGTLGKHTSRRDASKGRTATNGATPQMAVKA